MDGSLGNETRETSSNMDGSLGNETRETGEDDQISTWIGELSSSEREAVENGSSPCYIYKVPSKLRVGSVDKFEPRVVPIGPYHIKMENLEVTNNIKELFVRFLISRTTQGEGSRRDILTTMWSEISKLKADFRKCYSPEPDLTDTNFVKMLILDGCFILELLYRYQLDQMRDTDILFQNNWIIPLLQQDLVLLENQIPFRVLTYLFDIVPKVPKPQTNEQSRPSRDATTQTSTSHTYSLRELILHFFDPILPTTTIDNTNDIDNSSTTCKHLLDLLRTHLLHRYEVEAQPNEEEEDESKNPFWEHTTCATDLQNAGVIFKKKETNNGLLDITFSNEILEIPHYFGNSWAILFSNMIALEQCRLDYPDNITSYAILMDDLINTSADVKLLREKSIITGSKEEDKTIADIVNGLSKKAIYQKFHYDGVCNRLNKYRKMHTKRWRAAFYQNYIHTPWAGVSLIGALILLVLALIQTIFTILSWKLAFDDANRKGTSL